MIRSAIAGDKARVLVMAKAFHEASGVPLPFSAAAASVLFDAALVDSNRLCLVYEQDGIARGVLAAVAATHHLSPVKVASEIIWWIDPAWRGLAATRMLAAYEQWAVERECRFVGMVGLGADPAVSKLYARRGYQAVERHFLMPL
ncbi:GNAT family N-acetyltransferase [Agrobacterium rhizogenes]|nr:GNAT family N-acetyltransferase [Rhizobium rhizogenes]